MLIDYNGDISWTFILYLTKDPSIKYGNNCCKEGELGKRCVILKKFKLPLKIPK